MIDGVTAWSWMTCEHLRKVVSLVNNIWQPANIHFHIKTCTSRLGRCIPAQNILNEKENVELLFDKWRFPRDSNLTVFLVPVIANDVLGYTRVRSNPIIVMAVNRLQDVGIIQEDVSDFALTLAHEIGHALGLDHVNEEGNLMYPEVYTGSDRLFREQIQIARTWAFHLKQHPLAMTTNWNQCSGCNPLTSL